MNELLKCENLTKTFGKLVALNNINLTLTSGKIVGLLGPNGSGKTTLIKLPVIKPITAPFFVL